jgi:ATP-binding cassette subfamily C (CFTR/MRP) protein 10
MSELLTGIRVLKFFSWEDYFYKRANAHRTQELKFLRGRKYLVSMINILLKLFFLL